MVVLASFPSGAGGYAGWCFVFGLVVLFGDFVGGSAWGLPLVHI